MSAPGSRQHGQVATPAPVASFMARLAFEAWNGTHAPRVLDPAAGEGALLQAAREQGGNHTLFGIEQDAALARTCRERLQACSCPDTSAPCILTGDSLLDEPWRDERFDLILLNPPYVGIRALRRERAPEELEALATRYRCARGLFNLAWVMLERCLDWLAPDGVLCAIVPALMLENRDAAPLRRLLLTRGTLLRVIDLSGARVFPTAAAFPVILLFRAAPPPPNHETVFEQGRLVDAGVARDETTARVRQAELLDQPDGRLRPPKVEAPDLLIPRRERALGELAQLACGTAGFDAARVAASLVEGPSDAGWPFIVSGSIDPYRISRGPVRYQRRTYVEPVLLRASTPARRATWFDRHKIVIPGMCRVLEAALDDVGRAAGVAVYLAHMDDEALRWVVLAWLNAAPANAMLHSMFASRRMTGGYLSLNKRLLAQLPVRLPRNMTIIAEIASYLHYHPINTTALEQIDAAFLES